MKFGHFSLVQIQLRSLNTLKRSNNKKWEIQLKFSNATTSYRDNQAFRDCGNNDKYQRYIFNRKRFNSGDKYVHAFCHKVVRITAAYCVITERIPKPLQ